MREALFIDKLELHSSASMGVCLYPNDGGDAETLLKYADIAMYRAKEAGRDNYTFYSPEMNAKVEMRLSIESDLCHALDKNEFRLHYQPQYHVEDGRIKGCEALLRWCKEDKICVGPDLFVPVLEETGKIKEVGAWVIAEACRQLSDWNARRDSTSGIFRRAVGGR
jgi:predicted signal transduction protein with EAL and GGDEF domain